LEIVSFETLPSTQQWLVDAIRSGRITEPVAVLAEEQTAGTGSRGNRWEGGTGNFFASVAVRSESLPADLPPQAASIYFGWIMRESLRSLGEDVWLKWPNDLYWKRDKIGGVITQKLKDFLIVGIGVNLKKNQNSYSALNTDISALILLNIFLEKLSEAPCWKDILSKFRIEFDKSRAFFVHHNGTKISLQDARLIPDGSLQIHDERIYSLR